MSLETMMLLLVSEKQPQCARHHTMIVSVSGQPTLATISGKSDTDGSNKLKTVMPLIYVPVFM